MKTTLLATILSLVLLGGLMPPAAAGGDETKGEPQFRAGSGRFGPPGPMRHGAFPGHGVRGRGARMAFMAQELDLNAEQRDRIRTLKREIWSGELGEKTRTMNEAHADLQKLIRDPDADQTQVLEAVRALAVPTEEIALARHRLAVEIAAVLTPEQREKARRFARRGF